jgi:hypothetical protein
MRANFVPASNRVYIHCIHPYHFWSLSTQGYRSAYQPPGVAIDNPLKSYT